MILTHIITCSVTGTNIFFKGKQRLKKKTEIQRQYQPSPTRMLWVKKQWGKKKSWVWRTEITTVSFNSPWWVGGTRTTTRKALIDWQRPTKRRLSESQGHVTATGGTLSFSAHSLWYSSQHPAPWVAAVTWRAPGLRQVSTWFWPAVGWLRWGTWVPEGRAVRS